MVGWLNGTIDPLAGPLILGAIPRSPLIRGHVMLSAFTLVGLYGLGIGVWQDKPAVVIGGAVITLVGGAGEATFWLATRPGHRLPDHVVAAIAKEPAQFGIPRYNFRLANGEIAYWPVVGGAYLSRRCRRYRLDFLPGTWSALNLFPVSQRGEDGAAHLLLPLCELGFRACESADASSSVLRCSSGCA
jgi:hypothetical protein